MNRYIVSLGSNQQAEENITTAQHLLTQKFQQVRFAPTKWTQPEGKHYKAPFLNSAAIFLSDLSPEHLKATLKTIETQMGRIPEQKVAGIVPIDLDIIVCNRQIIHADYERFPFVKEAVDLLLSSNI